ncbi:MAG: hypothetical protein EBZ69_08955 [Alphaproteobacteria bacterium]|nr:hypothetical protein [Alphaproteobacteria bacterium]
MITEWLACLEGFGKGDTRDGPDNIGVTKVLKGGQEFPSTFKLGADTQEFNNGPVFFQLDQLAAWKGDGRPDLHTPDNGFGGFHLQFGGSLGKLFDQFGK